MTPFEPTGPEIPAAPIEIPTPDLPPANFGMIGGLLATGAAAAKDVGKWAGDILGLVAKIVGVVVVGLLYLIEKVVAFCITQIFKVWNSAQSGTDEISAAAVSGIFNTPIDRSAFGSIKDASGRQKMNVELVKTLTDAMGAGFIGRTAKDIEPSAEGANKFLQLAMNMSIEGWLQSWIADAFSFHELEKFGDLKDILERSLGIGRLSRQVLRPPVKIFVRDPFTALLNGLYHPTPLPLGVALKQYTRGKMTLEQLTPITDALGIPQGNIPALVNDARPHLSVAQLVDLMRAGLMAKEFVIQELQAVGYDAETAAAVLQAEQTTRFTALAKQYVAAAEAGMIARKMDVATFNSIVDDFTVGAFGSIGDVPPIRSLGSGVPIYSADEAVLVKATAYLKRTGATQLLPIGTAQQMFDLGLIGIDEFQQLLVLHGYTNGQGDLDLWSMDVDAAIDASLETPWTTWWALLATKKEIDAVNAAKAKSDNAAAKALAAKARLANAQSKAAAAIAGAEAKGVAIAKFETLVLDGLKTIAQYQDYLKAKGLAPDNVAAFTTVLQGKLTAKAAAGGATGGVVGTSKEKALSLSQIEAAVKQGFLSIADFEAKLVELGFTETDATLLGEVLQNSITAAQLKGSTSSTALAALGERKVSLAQEENAVVLGLQTIAQYEAMLKGAGFDDADVAILVGEVQAKLATAQAAAAKKAAAPGAAGAKHLAIAEIERLVRAGIQTPADYAAALVTAGYKPADVDAMVHLLNLLMEHDRHAAAASGSSNALLTSGGLSLGEVRTAVKLGVVPISVYDAALGAAGVSAGDARVLHTSLVAQLAAAAGNAAVVKRVNALLAPGGVTIADLESQVVSGAMPLVEFQSTLAAAGVLPPDVAILTARVQELLANAAAAGALVASVGAAAAAKSLNLAQAEAAVKTGVKDITWFQQFVAGLGYDAADVAILVAVEASKLGVPAPPPAS